MKQSLSSKLTPIQKSPTETVGILTYHVTTSRRSLPCYNCISFQKPEGTLYFQACTRPTRPTLYVNPSFTTGIKGLSKKEGQTLLELLFAHQSRPEFQVRFQWTVNAIALWDNRSAQHFAMWDYWPQPRQGHRVTIKGDPPQRGDFNQSRNYENLRLSRLVL